MYFKKVILILAFKIYLKQNEYKNAYQSLESGLSYNFKIKNHPTFHLIKARILKQQKQYEEAIKNLLLAMQLPGVKKACKTKKHFFCSENPNFD